MDLLKLRAIIFVHFLFILEIPPALSNVRCDCSTMSFIKQLVQQEMFERKLQDNMIRAELRKHVPGDTVTTATTGSDINNRVEALEQRFAEFERQVQSTQASIEEQRANKQTRVEKAGNQLLMNMALQREKMERVTFISQVQEKIEYFNDTFAEFRVKAESLINGHLQTLSESIEQFEKKLSQQFDEFRNELTLKFDEHAKKTDLEITGHRHYTHQFAQNVSETLDNFEVKLNRDMTAYTLQTKSDIANMVNNVSRINDEVKECIEETDALKVDIREIAAGVESNINEVTEIRGWQKEHVTKVDGRLNKITEFVGAVFTCPEGWERHRDKCYYFSKDSKPWLKSLEQCKRLRGEMVEIRNADENNYIAAKVKDINKEWWIGLTDRHSEGTWQWESSVLTNAVFTKWNKGEPNNVGSGEDCAIILNSPAGVWNDYHCTSPRHYICQIVIPRYPSDLMLS